MQCFRLDIQDSARARRRGPTRLLHDEPQRIGLVH